MADQQRAAVVTGAASGIGRAVVERLRDKYDYLACLDVADLDDEWQDADDVHGFAVDVRDPDAVSETIEAIESVAAVEAVVNNAGISQAVALSDLGPDEWDRVLDVNLKGQYLVARAAAPGMLERGRGAIVNVSSVAGLRGSATGGVHYSSSKAGVFGLTKGLAKQLGPAIRVNAVAPGLIETPLLTDSDLWTEAGLADYAAQLPLERIGTPDEVADAVAFLCTDASYVTGTVLTVDGGSMLR
ncbi:3-oxoacyl-[acyl-carrier protein] reductase [Halogranum rubrum]|uniref:3-oxoacyl-[acyl-carrier protein] reductase n=1 Tax=Halogranum rubrum TaxID=553466 RepID=A0A1I4FFA8_9EURY|nr:SDR family NAD(P)-dependent oxidoreductase [Halogranum rubrum]SFL15486.1 3-oxoacyl-[acyl-carrier protein] reductase [Halogranum rubrum]